jgi:tetratricopeptide (TPR) repeat protein
VLFEEALSRARERGERGDSEAEALHLLGDILRDLGRFDEAERALLDADAIFRELHGADAFVAANTHSLGDLALDRGNLAAALGLYRQSIDELRDRAPGQLAVCLAGIASVLADRKLDEDAATIWGAVCAAEKRLGFRIVTAERRRYETRLARLETTSAWVAGRNLTLEQAAASIPSS